MGKIALYCYGVNDSPSIDPEHDTKGAIVVSTTDATSKISGENMISMISNEKNLLEANVHGKANFKIESQAGRITTVNDIVDYSFDNFGTVYSLASLAQDTCKIEMFSFNPEGRKHIVHEVKEITDVKFVFPLIMTIKGGNEILVYSITEQLYYYTKLCSPFAFISKIVPTYNSLDVKGMVDLGNYFAF